MIKLDYCVNGFGCTYPDLLFAVDSNDKVIKENVHSCCYRNSTCCTNLYIGHHPEPYELQNAVAHSHYLVGSCRRDFAHSTAVEGENTSGLQDALTRVTSANAAPDLADLVALAGQRLVLHFTGGEAGQNFFAVICNHDVANLESRESGELWRLEVKVYPK